MSTSRYRVIALHGFLGAASDWDAFRTTSREARWDALDLWGLFSEVRVSDWESIGTTLSARLRECIGDDPLPAFLVGYSLGARLALSVPGLGSADSPVAGVCLVSCNPGLPLEDDGARLARKAADDAWAQKMIDAPVAQIWKAWDAQPVFAGSAVPRREPRLPGPRVTLARAMRLASLGTQPDRRPVLRAWQRPLLWVTGERDAKFRAIAASLAADVPARFVTLEHAGHRAPWDNPAAFGDALGRWIDDALATGRE
jgi:2-succinyl-6-hydroxy-2,4-cyclohexadiene-1-carboxylate synthase